VSSRNITIQVKNTACNILQSHPSSHLQHYNHGSPRYAGNRPRNSVWAVKTGTVTKGITTHTPQRSIQSMQHTSAAAENSSHTAPRAAVTVSQLLASRVRHTPASGPTVRATHATAHATRSLHIERRTQGRPNVNSTHWLRQAHTAATALQHGSQRQ